MQLPTDVVYVPDVEPVDHESIRGLVDFHEFKYLWPDSIPVLTRQLITADILGDDSFITFIAAELKVPVGRLLSSNKAQNIKQVIRDRFKLWSIGVELKVSTHDKCVLCSSGFLDRELTNFVACCGRTFHRSCLLDRKTCPYCYEPWGSLRCVKCAKSCVSPRERRLYMTFSQRRENRMPCCGVDVHFTCKKAIRQCPGCGELLNQRGQPIKADHNSFVYRRRERRRNDSKRRQL